MIDCWPYHCENRRLILAMRQRDKYRPTHPRLNAEQKLISSTDSNIPMQLVMERNTWPYTHMLIRVIDCRCILSSTALMRAHKWHC